MSDYRSEPREGLDIHSADLEKNNVYVTTNHGDVYRVWFSYNGFPQIEQCERNTPLAGRKGGM